MRVAIRSACLLALLALVLPILSAPAAAEGLELNLSPSSIQIGTTYNGATLTVSGQAPAGCDVVVRLLGAPAEAHMKKKGRALGLLWMNLGSLTYTDVPSVYLVSGNKPLEDLGPAAETYGLKGVESTFGVEPAAADTPEARSEFVKLKASEGLYRQIPAGVILDPATGVFRTDVRIPSRLSPGSYTVEVVALKDGQVVASKRAPIQVSLVEAPALLADMAFGHAALYGVLATLIAILAGLGIGLVFQSKGAH